MPKLNLKRTQTSGPKANNQSQAEAEATKFVQQFEEERQQLQNMRSEFDSEYPEAAGFLENIRQQEDRCLDIMKIAKDKVRVAGVTVGEFKLKRAFSKPGYDDKILTDLLVKLEDGGDLFVELAKAGVIKEVKTDKAATTAFLARNPEFQKPLSKAWKEEEELTPRITTPDL